MFQLVSQSRQQSIVINISLQKITFKSSNIQNEIPLMREVPAHINFPNLKVLKLGFVGLSRLQNLQFVNAPNLRCIQLYNNFIVSIKPFAKASFPKLQTISIYRNYVSSMKDFCRGHYKRLTDYQLDDQYEGLGNLNLDDEEEIQEYQQEQYQEQEQEQIIPNNQLENQIIQNNLLLKRNSHKTIKVMQDLSYLAKMQNPNLRKLYAQSRKRVWRQNIEIVLRRFNSKANIKIINKETTLISQMDRILDEIQNIRYD